MDPSAAPNIVSKAEYARMKGVNRSGITRWAQAGRVAVDAEGNILVAESEALLAMTADPSKQGVVKRHEQERGQAVIALDAAEAKSVGTKKTQHEAYGRRINESARHEAAKAERAEIELAQLKGEITDVDGVKKAMADFATLTRQTYERVAFDLKLRLAVEMDPDKVFVLLKNAIDDASRKISDTLKAQLDSALNTRQ